MKTIWKFPIEITDRQVVKIHGATLVKVIHVGLDPDGQACIWAEVVPENVQRRGAERLVVYVFGTGNPINFEHGESAALHVGSFNDDPFVWHVYAMKKI